MNNFIFKSANRLTKNSSINLAMLDAHLELILREQRHQRSDLQDVNHKLDRLLVDKHLQMQVDNYFKDEEHIPDNGSDIGNNDAEPD